MKVKLKLSADELRLISEKLTPVNGINFNELAKEKRTAYSILLDVSDKVIPKAQKISRQLTLGADKQSVTFKWHEAQALEQYLISISNQCNDHFSQNLLLKIISQLNQKLA